MYYDVAQRLAVSAGLDLVRQKNTINLLLNNGAKELYDRLECNKLLWENTLRVPVNKVVSLPNYLGELRGIRSSISGVLIDIQGMSQPRYTSNTWKYRWKNWRDLGESAVQQLPSLVGPLTVTSIVQNPPITLLISAQTNSAFRIEERLLLDAEIKQTTNLFGPQIYQIACMSNRDCDITISDANGIILAVLPNTDRKTRYKMVDVSQFPGLLDVSDSTGNTSLIDVLYKVPLRKLTEDSDSFPSGDAYDNAWYYFALWLYYLPMQNKAKETGEAFAAALVAAQSVKDGTEKSIDKRINFGRNKYFDMFKRRFFYGSSSNPNYYAE
jgi:hypothetical protein